MSLKSLLVDKNNMSTPPRSPKCPRSPRIRQLSCPSTPNTPGGSLFAEVDSRKDCDKDQAASFRKIDQVVETQVEKLKFTPSQRKRFETLRLDIFEAEQNLLNAVAKHLPEESYRNEIHKKKEELRILLEQVDKKIESSNSCDRFSFIPKFSLSFKGT